MWVFLPSLWTCMYFYFLQAGIYWFQILDWYSASHCLLIIVFFELIGLAYVYGKCRYYFLLLWLVLLVQGHRPYVLGWSIYRLWVALFLPTHGSSSCYVAVNKFCASFRLEKMHRRYRTDGWTQTHWTLDVLYRLLAGSISMWYCGKFYSIIDRSRMSRSS